MLRGRAGFFGVACLLATVGVLTSVLMGGEVSAQQASSTNYSVDEVFFGTGGELEACSTTYCTKQSAGETAVGSSTSTSYESVAGFNTNREEYLEFVVNSSNTDLGVLSASSAATATGTFKVKAYLASGYVVLNAANPPRYGTSGPFLANLTSPTASSPGTEQFGINLVANTTGCGAPVNFGAAPVQVPDSTFSFGAAATGYNTCGQFKYVNGDAIASSIKSSGETDYSVSYLYNISNTTPAGTYVFNHVMVAVATY